MVPWMIPHHLNNPHGPQYETVWYEIGLPLAYRRTGIENHSIARIVCSPPLPLLPVIFWQTEKYVNFLYGHFELMWHCLGELCTLTANPSKNLGFQESWNFSGNPLSFPNPHARILGASILQVQVQEVSKLAGRWNWRVKCHLQDCHLMWDRISMKKGTRTVETRLFRIHRDICVLFSNQYFTCLLQFWQGHIFLLRPPSC